MKKAKGGDRRKRWDGVRGEGLEVGVRGRVRGKGLCLEERVKLGVKG